MIGELRRPPDVSAATLLLLLPAPAGHVRVQGPLPSWVTGVSGWERDGADGVPHVVVGGSPALLAAQPGDAAVLLGSDRHRRLASQYARVRRYRVQRRNDASVLLEPQGAVDAAPRTVDRPRRLPAPVVAALARPGRLSVACAGDPTPAAVRAACGAGSRAYSLLAGGGGQRRRGAFLVAASRSDPGRDAMVVKAGPSSWAGRGQQEQAVLRSLQQRGVRGSVPEPRGHGIVGAGSCAVAWSAESTLVGRPLAHLVDAWPVGRLRGQLALVARVLTDLAVATRTPGLLAEADLHVRGAFLGAGERGGGLNGVPGVLVHGDVASGVNVLVGGRGPGLIDWETAQEGGPPLTDLLPLLALAMATARGHRTAHDATRYALRLCAGQEADSAWALGLVRTYLKEVGVPAERAGALAAMAWAREASLLLVHDELLRAEGLTPAPSRSPAEGVARAWASTPGLGPRWSALGA